MNAKRIIGLIVVIAVGAIAWAFASTTAIQNQNQTQTNATSKMQDPMMGHSNHAATVTDDKSFILGMVPHHEEAVTSSEELLKVAKTPEVRELAQNIITAQKKEISDMKTWYVDWFGEEYKGDGNYKAMMPSLTGKDADDAEQAYLMGMIMHHNAAIQMANAILQKTDRSELKILGENIIKTQNDEVDIMKRLIKPASMMHNSH